MKTFKILVLTDHATHGPENSLYELLRELSKNPRCAHIDVASRSLPRNKHFFYRYQPRPIYASRVHNDFDYHEDGRGFRRGLRRVSPGEYDLLFMRLPPPVEPEFWSFIRSIYWEQHIINQPTGIELTSSKKFLLNFPDICPAMMMCHTVEDIITFKEKHPIVLKPLRSYGGKGIVRIDGERVWVEQREQTLDEFLCYLTQHPTAYLGMEFLHNVGQGDKRVIVINGRIIGASLRVPPPNSWICNASQGGQARAAAADEDEQNIIKRLDPVLKRLGVTFYGVDTLVGNDGRRVLSEINTMSVGGLIQMARLNGQPLVQRSADELWNYVKTEVYGDSTCIIV